jgi:hypothetical protein
MNEQFQAIPLDLECASAAYPLVRLHDAGITLEKWLRFVRRRGRTASGRTGITAIRDCRGIIHALFSYRVDIDLRARKRLCIGHLIVAHLPGSRIDDAVTAATSRIATRLGCQTISIEQPFTPRPGVAAGCPTAQLLPTWQRSDISTRQH